MLATFDLAIVKNIFFNFFVMKNDAILVVYFHEELIAFKVYYRDIV